MEDNKNLEPTAQNPEENNQIEKEDKKKKDKKPILPVRIINGIGRIHNWCKDKISKHPTGAATVLFTGGTIAGWALKGFVGMISEELSKMDEEDEDLTNDASDVVSEEQALNEISTDE